VQVNSCKLPVSGNYTLLKLNENYAVPFITQFYETFCLRILGCSSAP